MSRRRSAVGVSLVVVLVAFLVWPRGASRHRLSTAPISTTVGSAPSPRGSSDGVNTGPTAGSTLAVPADGFGGTQYPVDPYIDRSYVDSVPRGQGSFNLQPWRGYLETVPATQMLAGIGLNYNLPSGTDDRALIGVLAGAGVRSLRIEVSWDQLTPDESALEPSFASRLSAILTACHHDGIVPLILLNANDRHPQPMATTTRTAVDGASAGATSVHLNSVAGLTMGASGIDTISGNSGPGKAGVLLTSADASSNVVQLSRPLPTSLSAGQTLSISTFHHVPLYPTGTSQFEDTAAAWLHYAGVVTAAVTAAGITTFDVEIWNELTFGSAFLDINNYYSPPLNPLPRGAKYQSGGSVWELSRRTAAQIHQSYGSAVHVIWGFSNTIFELAPPSSLPSGIDGQSYHPYHSDIETVGQAGVPVSDAPASQQIAIPESAFATNLRPTTPIVRLLPPWIRAQQPTNFAHYVTETGVAPQLVNIIDPIQQQDYKARSLLREYAFWLNKGITKLDVFAAYGKTDSGYGVLDNATAPASSPALVGLHNFTTAFSGAVPPAPIRSLGVSVAAVGTQSVVDPGASTPLHYRDLFAFMPFQASAHRFVVPVYVLTPDATKPLPGGVMGFRVTIQNVAGARAEVTLYDPLTNASVSSPILASTSTSVTVGVSAVDYPRILTIDDT